VLRPVLPARSPLPRPDTRPLRHRGSVARLTTPGPRFLSCRRRETLKIADRGRRSAVPLRPSFLAAARRYPRTSSENVNGKTTGPDGRARPAGRASRHALPAGRLFEAVLAGPRVFQPVHLDHRDRGRGDPAAGLPPDHQPQRRPQPQRPVTPVGTPLNTQPPPDRPGGGLAVSGIITRSGAAHSRAHFPARSGLLGYHLPGLRTRREAPREPRTPGRPRLCAGLAPDACLRIS